MWELPLKKDTNGSFIIIPPKRNYSGITKTNQVHNPDGYIYFIKASGFEFYKIGVSSSPQRRICDIDSYMPFDLEILSLHSLKNVYAIEKEFQEKLRPYKIRREWYKLTVAQAKEIMIDLHNLNVNQDVCTTG